MHRAADRQRDARQDDTREGDPDMMKKAWTCVGIAALTGSAILGLHGCGGGDSSSESTTTTSAPSIATQPSSVTVSSGASATFTVVATGSGTLSYQWYKDSTAIS